MKNKSDRRNFDRFSIEFEMEVSAEDIEGNKYKETVILENISGGGAKFISRQADKYFPDQSLKIVIYLPEVDDVKAYMKGEATVVRIDSPDNSGIDGKSRGTGIAIRIDTCLHFERADIKRQETLTEP